MTMMALSLCIGLLDRRRDRGPREHRAPPAHGQEPSAGGRGRHQRDRPRGDGHHLRDRRGVRAGGLHERHRRQVLLLVRHHRHRRGAGVAVRVLHARPDAVERCGTTRPRSRGCCASGRCASCSMRFEHFVQWMHRVYGRLLGWTFSGRVYRLWFPSHPRAGQAGRSWLLYSPGFAGCCSRADPPHRPISPGSCNRRPDDRASMRDALFRRATITGRGVVLWAAFGFLRRGHRAARLRQHRQRVSSPMSTRAGSACKPDDAARREPGLRGPEVAAGRGRHRRPARGHRHRRQRVRRGPLVRPHPAQAQAAGRTRRARRRTSSRSSATASRTFRASRCRSASTRPSSSRSSGPTSRSSTRSRPRPPRRSAEGPRHRRPRHQPQARHAGAVDPTERRRRERPRPVSVQKHRQRVAAARGRARTVGYWLASDGQNYEVDVQLPKSGPDRRLRDRRPAADDRQDDDGLAGHDHSAARAAAAGGDDRPVGEPAGHQAPGPAAPPGHLRERAGAARRATWARTVAKIIAARQDHDLARRLSLRRRRPAAGPGRIGGRRGRRAAARDRLHLPDPGVAVRESAAAGCDHDRPAVLVDRRAPRAPVHAYHAQHVLDHRLHHADGPGHQERHPAGRLRQPAATRRPVARRRIARGRPGTAADRS